MSARLHVGEIPLAAGASLALPREASHHALRVLRLRDGDAVTLFDGRGGEWHGVIASGGRRGEDAIVAIERFDAVERESPLAVKLAMSTLATDAMDYAVRKAVELGCASVAPVVAARSQGASHRGTRVEHWRRIAIAACEQCGRNRIPPIDAPVTLAAWLDARDAGRPGIVFAPGAGATLASLAPTPALDVLVGPEGGFDAAELAAAKLAGLTAVSLGPRVLKAETAAVAALSALQALHGDLR
ncbi:MAG TPA: 16S rRNA (uracil(1498)-N(3))-methyltransferase [Casimicrobiaceae bacterium]